ncbi:MAG: sulfatase-like hydrolase/transferase [Pigmentiphaga sp.]|nr:sulfatase-like hydrolase/transferase [Pigmentiphaga sp.]
MKSSLPYCGWLRLAAPLVLAAAVTACGSDSESDPPEPPVAQSPNILFIVLDDLAVDQFTSYGYGGALPPNTPVLNTIAQAGVQFQHMWAMPTCTPTRSAYFTGRYPSVTNILNAVVSTDLANSEISPYEVTLPKLLRHAGYTSALIGKMHLTGSDLDTAANLPYGHQTMWKLGWDYFNGYLDGAPYPIDTRAGRSNVAEGTYVCGYVPNTTLDPSNGADAGACYHAAGTCEPMSRSEATPIPGRICMEQGGIFDPNASCQATTPAYLDFDVQNGYYASEFVTSFPDGSTNKITASHPDARGYRTTLETDRAIAWASQQPSDQPWMMSLGYSAMHTPLQLPPRALIAADTPGRNDPLVCMPMPDTDGIPSQIADVIDNHLISNLMIEAIDTEIGRLLVELGLASRNADGSLHYEPEKTNTMVVITGDNGTWVNSVKFTQPGRFDPTRGKGSPYQTGVWVPLMVAGPLVSEPGRELDFSKMANATDLYRLFADIAGVDVDALVPADRPIDGQPLLPYLTNPEQPPIRDLNFTEMGTNFGNPQTTTHPQPCVMEAADTCFVIFPNKALCDDQGGVWYGEGSILADVPVAGFDNCGQVMSYRQARDPNDAVDVLPVAQKAVTDGDYKLVRRDRKHYTLNLEDPTSVPETDQQIQTDELYRINDATPNPLIDRSDAALAMGEVPLAGLTGEQQMVYNTLKAELDHRDAVASYNYQYDTLHCPGDGNRDLVVDQTDVDNWTELSRLNLHEGVAQSSWYDFNHDGLTDEADLRVIQNNLGMRCQAMPG